MENSIYSFENNPQCSSLTKAMYLRASFFFFEVGRECKPQNVREHFHMFVHKIEECAVDFPLSIQTYIQNGYKIIPNEMKMLLWPIAYCYCGRTAESEQQALLNALEWFRQLRLGKLGYYSSDLARVIFRLNHGLPITDVDKTIEKYWECVVKSHDMESAMINADKIKGNKTLGFYIVFALAAEYYRIMPQKK